MRILPLYVPGQGIITGPKGVPQGGTGMFEKILQTGIQILLIGAILIAFFYLVWGGLNWITSEGDKQKVHSARLQLSYAIIGLFIVFLAFLAITLVGGSFGIQLISLP